MKNSKVKEIIKPKKPTKAGVAVKSNRVTTRKSGPSEEEIRQKAMEIYYERIARGEHGTEESDWLEAEEFLRSSTKK